MRYFNTRKTRFFKLIRIITLLLLLCTNGAYAQYYLRGDVRSEKSAPLQNARILIHSSKSLYYSGTDGSFGIIMRQQEDTITVSLDGYEPVTMPVRVDVWQKVVLKTIINKSAKNKNRLISLTMDKQQSKTVNYKISNETYFKLVENDFIDARTYPSTGYSLNVNKASYSNARRFINGGSEVPPDAVKIEEMINYFNNSYVEPDAGKDFKVCTYVTACPWQAKDQLLYINVNARKLALDSVPPANFVFLIDISGSMDDEKKLPLVQAAFQLFLENIRPVDTVSIITYGGGVLIRLQPTSGEEKDKIKQVIDELEAIGDTPGEAALLTAYQLAEKTFIKKGNNRIILATDGDFNVGETNEKALEELVARYKNKGIYLTCLGVGTGNLKDSKLQVLAKKGNGNYAYIDDLQEAEKILVTELTQTMYAVADNALLHVEFNPSVVSQYRLIGFDNRRDALSDGENLLEGGEIGSGSQVMAIFQITPTQLDTIPNDKLIADLHLSYQSGRDTTKKLLEYSVKHDYKRFDELPSGYQFSTIVTAFGLKLKRSEHASISWDQLLNMITWVKPKHFLEEEFLQLVEKASYIYEPKRKKKKSRT